MRKKSRIKFYPLYSLWLVFFFTSCLSVMEWTGRLLDGSIANEKKVAQYKGGNIELTIIENREEERSILISISNYPMMKLKGSMPDENNNFFIVSLEYLAGSFHGWNEYTMDILGEGELILDEEAVLSVSNDIELVQISKGRIHRFDTRITGAEALTNLRNRRERIAATVEWMASAEGAPRGQTIDEFEKYWKPLLFPEIAFNSQRPALWLQEGDVYITAEDIKWNTGYTERTFPSELVPVRDSGTMLRDFEEALSWIYLEYEWENIVNILSRKVKLQKIM